MYKMDKDILKEGGIEILEGCFKMLQAKIVDSNINKASRVYEEICETTKNKYYRRELALKSAKILEIIEKYEEGMIKTEGDLEKVVVRIAQEIELEIKEENI